MAALAAACTSETAPTTPPPATSSASSAAAPAPKAAPKRTVDPDNLRAKDALGDFTTVDPCSMVTLINIPAKYTKGGAASFDQPGDVDSCTVDLSLTLDNGVAVEWGRLERADSVAKHVEDTKRQKLGHGLSLMQGYQGADECQQYLVFADDTTMNVDTTVIDGKPTGLCAVNKAVIDLIVKSLLAKQPRQRTMPAGSLTHQDACKMLTPELARSLPGAAGAKNDQVYPAHHVCHYTAPNLEQVILSFTVLPVDYDPPKEAKHVKIGGRDTVQFSDYSDGLTGCQLSTKHIQLASTSYAHRSAEALELIAFVDGKSSSLCAQLGKLAEKLWQKLPAA